MLYIYTFHSIGFRVWRYSKGAAISLVSREEVRILIQLFPPYQNDQNPLSTLCARGYAVGAWSLGGAGWRGRVFLLISPHASGLPQPLPPSSWSLRSLPRPKLRISSSL